MGLLALVDEGTLEGAEVKDANGKVIGDHVDYAATVRASVGPFHLVFLFPMDMIYIWFAL